MTSLDLTFDLGGLDDTTSGVYDLLLGPFVYSTTSVPIVYVSTPGGGAGLVGIANPTPDLTAFIFMDPLPVFEENLLNARIKPVTSVSTEPFIRTYLESLGGGIGLVASTNRPDLTASLQPSLFFTDQLNLSGYYLAQTSSGNALRGFYRATESSNVNLSGTIDGVDEAFLTAFYRPTFSGELGGLIGDLEVIEPLKLLAELTGVTGLDLFGNIEPISPTPLEATVTGISFQNLLASIEGFDKLDLLANVSGTNISPELQALVSGTALGSGTLSSTLHGYKGVEQSAQLRAI
ncbi:MAG: hypothetical protein DRQ39_11140, partial [Gammaproteobacteria bacterium]